MSDSNFDPNSFLDATVTQESVSRPPIPAGTDLVAIIQDITGRKVQGKKDPSKTYTFMDVKLVASVPPDLQSAGHPPEVTYTDGISLDLTEGGAMDLSPGKNGKLGAYRKALN